MKALIQRVKRASVTIENELYSKIGAGLLVFLGVEKTDSEENADKLVDKIMLRSLIDGLPVRERKILLLRFFKDKTHDSQWWYNKHDFWKSSCFARFVDLKSTSISRHS